MAAFMSAPIYFTSKEGLLPIHDHSSLVNQVKKQFINTYTYMYMYIYIHIQYYYLLFMGSLKNTNILPVIHLQRQEAEFSPGRS